MVTQPRARYLDAPVAIIGAGIGGLTAALSLQHSGVPVRVFEQARALREIGAGVTITPNAMNVLDFLGIGPALAEQAGETPRYFVRSAADGRELERGPDPTLPGNAASRLDCFRSRQREDRRDARLVLVQPGDRAHLSLRGHRP